MATIIVYTCDQCGKRIEVDPAIWSGWWHLVTLTQKRDFCTREHLDAWVANQVSHVPPLKVGGSNG